MNNFRINAPGIDPKLILGINAPRVKPSEMKAPYTPSSFGNYQFPPSAFRNVFWQKIIVKHNFEKLTYNILEKYPNLSFIGSNQ